VEIIVRWAGLWENIWFVSYLGSGLLTWLVFWFCAFAGRRRMQLFEKERPAPAGMPHVTILIPAKDEEGRIEGCLRSALSQDYANFDVIAIDDRSVDGTGRVMDEIAAGDSRLSVIHIQEGTLGAGWTGKNNALFTGALRAKGDWLLFVDSDVILQPPALSRSIAVAVFKEFDLLSLLPRLETHTIWESLLIPLCSAAAGLMYLIALNNSAQHKKISFANGQFILMSRASYDAIGGHEAVKDRLCEDMEIARIMKEKGFRPRVSWGEEFAAVRMYSSFGGIIRGWSRIYYAAKVGKAKQVLLAMYFLLTSCFTGYVALGYGIFRVVHPGGNMFDDAWVVVAGLHLAVMTYVISCMYRWSKNSGWNGLLFPIGGVLLLWTLWKALVMCVTKKVEWRGTSYSHTMGQSLTVKP
jgi:Glycosyl transferase family 2